MRSAKLLLLVEDNLDDVVMIQRAVCEAAAATEVIHFPDAEQALVYLRSPANPRPTLILLDLKLPGISGVEFLKAVKAEASLAALPVVVLTTSDERDDIRDSFDLSVAGYIVKPTDYTTLVETAKTLRDYWSLSHIPSRRN
jgi:DNA-binding response OmpR family regulator